MNTLYIDNEAHIDINEEEKKVVNQPKFGYSVRHIYPISEETHVVYSVGECKRELDAQKGDVLVTFYHNEFDSDIILLKSEEFYNLCINKIRKEQEEKERWAQEKIQCKGCDAECSPR